MSATAILLSPDSYQTAALSTAIYPPVRALEYTTLGLVGEVGEIAEKICAWNFETSHDRDDARAELGDVCWYVATLAHTFGARLSELPAVPEKVAALVREGWRCEHVLALAAHAGAIANKAKKVIRDDRPMDDIRPFVLLQLSCVLAHAGALAIQIGSTLDDVMSANAAKLLSRKQRNVIAGDGDNR